MKYSLRAFTLLCLTCLPTAAWSQDADSGKAAAAAPKETEQAATPQPTAEPSVSGKKEAPAAAQAEASKKAKIPSADAETAAEAKKNPRGGEKWATTEPPADDLSYKLMGEFTGPIEISQGEFDATGLQIRVVGDDRIEALMYRGGLPGAGQSNEEPIVLEGRRYEDRVVLSGGPWAIFAEQDYCLVLDRGGKQIGRMERVVRSSPTMGAQPPEGAVVLFDGSGLDQFVTASMGKDGLLQEGANVKPMFQDFNLHVEFKTPYMPYADGQARGNSGCYLQGRYEVQILDSFGTLPVFNGCSSLYRTKPADVNMAFPPLQWQTYDIMFTAPRWAADGSKIRDAHITVWHNGVKTQDNFAIPNKTGAGKEEAPTLLPSRFQDHRDPVRFRNIWVVDRGLSHSDFPVYPNAAE